MENNLDMLLKLAISAAVQAGKGIMDIYTDESSDFGVEMKSDNSPLTIADKKSDAIISSYLLEHEFHCLNYLIVFLKLCAFCTSFQKSYLTCATIVLDIECTCCTNGTFTLQSRCAFLFFVRSYMPPPPLFPTLYSSLSLVSANPLDT